MPLYDYICTKCNESWEEMHSISNRKEPESKPCPKCGAEECVEQSIVISPVAISVTLEAERAIRKLNNGSAFKEKLQQIHNNTPGSQLNKSSTIVDIK